MNVPCISVIIPAYNHEPYIAAALQSVLQQTFGDFELIVIDDGSKDNTWYEIQQIVDTRLRAFRQENRGAAATINRGIEMARGRYVTILNSDDVYHPERLALCWPTWRIIPMYRCWRRRLNRSIGKEGC